MFEEDEARVPVPLAETVFSCDERDILDKVTTVHHRSDHERHCRARFGRLHAEEDQREINGGDCQYQWPFPSVDCTSRVPCRAWYASYCGAYIWPQVALPELEVAFKDLGKLIFDVVAGGMSL
ncbi:hypothetical protein F3Y22_tig00000340pilonHSYRG00275 [Hibiscus syriacus]|uniref:Uncharacterized protein n=1 Tax=Hibiscus syriacus TaxID=106335 RepID=A0A6A3D449_HIBSY|nr:hypothetical protein F3Y22_tig00000340pilonHSYRG00275 [Hibiscus syriacus]